MPFSRLRTSGQHPFLATLSLALVMVAFAYSAISPVDDDVQQDVATQSHKKLSVSRLKQLAVSSAPSSGSCSTIHVALAKQVPHSSGTMSEEGDLLPQGPRIQHVTQRPPPILIL